MEDRLTLHPTWPFSLGSAVKTARYTLGLPSPVGTDSDTMWNTMQRHLKLSSNSSRCKHCWTASRHVVGHLHSAAHSWARSLTAQESFLHGAGSLHGHEQPLWMNNGTKRGVGRRGAAAAFGYEQHGLKAPNWRWKGLTTDVSRVIQGPKENPGHSLVML